jgi:cell division septation protein DedD
MEDPASPPKLRRTCPTCNRPVEPGYKFCETCGTRIPDLSTCSKCGTQFIAPVRYCDLCGAPVIPGKVPEPDDSAEHPEEEDTRPVEDRESERVEEEIPEPATGELPEDTDEETLIPAEEETPHHHIQEIQEPDTDELLEKYRKEYDENETLESSHTPKSASSPKREAKKPVTVPGPPDRGSSETVDDALFLSPGKPEAPVKPYINRTRIIAGCIVLIMMSVAVYFIGLPMLTDKNPQAGEITPTPVPTNVVSITPTPTKTSTPASRALIPLPTQTIPSDPKFHFDVQKNPVTSRISVIFTGSGIQSADIKVTHPEGSFASGIIMPLKGSNEIVLDGSQGTDRVEIIAQVSDGKTYRVYDQLISGIRAF